jgi:hypothetical protein
MRLMHAETGECCSVESRLLDVLRENGPQTLERLCALPDVSWAQVLLAVDHLSRTHAVAIELIAPCEYQVSLSGGEA